MSSDQLPWLETMIAEIADRACCALSTELQLLIGVPR
jgi:hypothetical protein